MILDRASEAVKPLLRERSATDAWLLRAAALFAVAVVVHNGDHLRRGADALDRDVFWLGTAGVLIEVLIVVLICQRHRLAPLGAAVTGISLAVGYVSVHFLPAREWFSDSFPSGTDVSPISWFAASIEVVAAVALAATGLASLSARGGLVSAGQPHISERSWTAAVAHPLALVFTLSQGIVLAVSFLQL